MAHRDGSSEARPRQRLLPSIEGLEVRQLLSTSSAASQVAYVRHKDHQYVSELQHLELKSQATPAEYAALRDDARRISQAAASTTLAPAVADQKAAAVSDQLDRAALDGWLDAPGWAGVTSRLSQNLSGLNVPPALFNQTVADMKAVADSAQVSSADYQQLSFDADSLRRGEATIRNSGVHFPDPGLYYAQHLRGFFRGGSAQHHRDQAKLDQDIRDIAAESSSPAGSRTTLRRDTGILEKLGASVPAESAVQLGDAYVAAFQQATPSAPERAQLNGEISSILVAGGATPPVAKINRLVADVPAVASLVGGLSSKVATLVADVEALISDGGGTSLNPFKVVVARPLALPPAAQSTAEIL